MLSRVRAFVARHPTATVFGVALAMRLLAVAVLRAEAHAEGGDAGRYLSLAVDLLSGLPYGFTSGDVVRPPLYPLFVALHLWVFGSQLIWIAISQACVSALTAVLVLRIGWELLPGSRTLLPGLLWAFYPSSILNVVVIYPQPLQIFFLLLAIFLVLRGERDDPSGRSWQEG